METTTGINLSKGQKIDLTKTNPAVSKYRVGLGWNPNTAVGGTFDIDVSAFILGSNGKRLSDKHFLFYNNIDGNNTSSESNSDRHVTEGVFGVLHNGDNRTGEGEGDDETLSIDFSKVPTEAESIVFVVTIHDAATKNQNFGQISGSYIRIIDETTGNELMKYDLNEDYSIETAMIFGKLYKREGEWKFEAVGTGMKGGLQDYINQY